MAVPVFFFIAFTGALSAVGNTRGFGYYNFTAFEFVFVMFQAAIFAGVFTAIDVGIDYGSGIGDRLMVASPRRLAIILGYVITSLLRAGFGIGIVWAIGLAIGMPVRGGVLDIVALVALGLFLNVAATLYGLGIALRFRSAAAGVLVMIPAFMIMFLSPVFSPRDRLSGWLETAASWNPLTPPLESGRGFLANDPVRVWAAFGACAGLVAFFMVWAVLGMHKAEQGPGGGAGARRRGPPGPRGRRRRGR
jgi:ABC-2 type transport system permease protein